MSEENRAEVPITETTRLSMGMSVEFEVPEDRLLSKRLIRKWRRLKAWILGGPIARVEKVDHENGTVTFSDASSRRYKVWQNIKKRCKNLI